MSYISNSGANPFAAGAGAYDINIYNGRATTQVWTANDVKIVNSTANTIVPITGTVKPGQGLNQNVTILSGASVNLIIYFNSGSIIPGNTYTIYIKLPSGTQNTITVSGTTVRWTDACKVSNVAPASAPGAPTIGTATPGNGSATVSFTAPASNGGATITSYKVTSNPGNKTATGAGTSLTVSGLTNGTAYTFTVTATNSGGTGAASGATTAVTPRTTPGAPTGVSATPGNGSASVSFTAPVSNGGSTITSYTATSSPGGFTGTGSGSSITVSGLTAGTAYTFTVTATNAAGAGAASSPSTAVTPYTTAGAPTGVSATPGNGSASVSFTAPASTGGSTITSYTATSSPGGFTGTGSGSSITVSGLTNGTAYTFTVTATNAAGAGAASLPSTAVTPRAPSDAGSISGTPSEHLGYGSNFTELAVSGHRGTTIQWQSSITSPTEEFSNITDATAETYQVTNIRQTTYYRVVVTNDWQAPATSTAVTLTVDPQSLIDGISAIDNGQNKEEAPNPNIGYQKTVTLSLTGTVVGTIEWQSSSDSTYWSPVGTAESTYTSEQLSAPIYYRALVTNLKSPSVPSSIIYVTVDAESVAGRLTASLQEIGYSKSTVLTLANYTGTVYWQSSTDNITYADIENASGSSYTASGLTANTYYRARVQSGESDVVTSTTVYITVDANTVAGAVTADTTLIRYNTAPTLNVSGNIGTTFQWQSSATDDNYVDIEGATSVPFTPNAITTNTYYRLIVTNGSSDPATTNGLLISVETLPGTTPSVTAAASGANQATVSWTPVSDNGGFGIVLYRVYAYAGSSAGDPKEVAGTESSTTITGLTAGTSYTFKVSASSGAGYGAQSAASNSVTVTATTPAPTTTVAPTTTRAPGPDGIPCFAEGTRILTQTGYKAIEALKSNDLIITGDHRAVTFKRMKTTLQTTTVRTAPYLIQPHAFGRNLPSAPIRLSPIHKIQIGKGRWITAEIAAHTNPLVKQCDIGESVTYYHIECKEYLKDDIITEGLVVESFGSRKAIGDRKDIYIWSKRLNAYTRVGYGTLSKTA